MAEALKKDKRAERRNLLRLKDEIEKLQAPKTLTFENLGKLEAILADYKVRKVNFENLVDQLIESADDTNKNFAEWETNLMKEVAEIADVVYTCEGKIKNFHKNIFAEESRSSLVPSDLNRSSMGLPNATGSTQPKLKKIDVPKFDGDILKFGNFRRLFENLIHTNEELTNVQKLYYLKEAMIGEAEDIVRDFPLEERAYPEAWSYILSRYENPRKVVKTLFRKLTDLKAIKADTEIRKLLDDVDIILRGLKAAEESINETFSRFIAFLVITKLDVTTARDFENSVNTTKKCPTYEELRKFLQIRSFVAEDQHSEAKLNPIVSSSKVERKRFTTEKKTFVVSASNTNNNSKVKCVVCSENHFLNQCRKFRDMKVSDRYDVVKSNRLCIKCFSPFHVVVECKRYDCMICKGNHHTLLHREGRTSFRNARSDSTVPEKEKENNSEKVSCLGGRKNSQKVYLSTAVVKVLVNSKWVLARVLLDNGSEINIVSRSFVKRNNIATERASVNLTGITNNSALLDSSAQLNIRSRFNEFELSVEANVAEKIPYSVVNDLRAIFDLVPGLQYAEMKLPHNDVDILLGIEHYEAIIENKRKLIEGLTIRDTKFGCVVSGVHQSSSSKNSGFVGLTTAEIGHQLERFWKVEESSHETSELEESRESKLIEETFEQTYSKTAEGRFVVNMLMKPGVETLHGSFGRALSTLKRYERHSSAEKKKAYREFMQEYESLGHMRKLNAADINVSPSYYIPHHIISRPTSTTTKYRVVFNASATDKSGSSLNDFLYVGPTIQPELFDAVIRFRMYNVAFVGDIEKMYRQIFIEPTQRRFQRILWRSNENEEINHYELNTVTYGTASAPYLATKCLQVLANELESTNSEAAAVIRNHFYMDDLMTGHDNVANAIELQKTVHAALESVKFPLRKYQSNSAEFLKHIDPALVAASNTKLLGAESLVFVLGLVWCTQTDELSVSISSGDLPDVITKRVVLSDTSKIFDVLGMLSPVTVRGKLILQDLWREQLKWDDPISDDLVKKFLSYREDLKKLRNFAIDRRFSSFNVIQSRQLIGFCDASVKAYCAVIYQRSIDWCGNIDLKFLCGKTRVAPVKVVTIPRLELMAAVMLARLIARNGANLGIPRDNVSLFSDSTIVLSWLKLPLNKLKSFVATRVSTVNEKVNEIPWYYVSTKLNPADVGTRGVTADQFLSNNLWIQGPPELLNDFNSFLSVPFNTCNDVPELRKERTVSLLAALDTSILYRYSSYSKLLNVISYMYRFVNRSRRIVKNFESDVITVSEHEFVFRTIVKLSQRNQFERELIRLTENREVKKSSSLRSLSPFLDNNGIIRVGGRLKNADLPFDKKHPIILSARCPFVRLYLTYLHEKYFHCNKGVILTYVVNRFWIIGGCANLVKRIIRECVLCTRLKAVLERQIMGHLPNPRSSVSRPFTHVGVDFTGHFTIKCLNHRSPKSLKVYAAFFVCFCTRAVHIELVSDLTSQNFIESLQRFISRRGKPACLYSDNGSNFVGANNIFKKQRDKLTTWATSEMIDWKFNIPRTPHQGGLWEAAVKSGKSLLVKATTNSVLTFEELLTILCRVECILNSRPLCYTVKPDDAYEVITPGHFLIGDSLLNSAENLDDRDLNVNTRLYRVQVIINSFWKQWQSSYLNELQRRNKWNSKRPNVNVGDIVIVKDDNLNVLDWPMGRIVEVFSDSNGIVRNCNIKLSNKIVSRNVSRIVKLINTDVPEHLSPPE